MTEELELAFDAQRVRKFANWHKSRRTLRVFDGERLILDEKELGQPQESYGIGPSPGLWFYPFFADLSWLRVGVHDFWFERAKLSREERKIYVGLPEDYSLLDQADFRGRRCYVLENRVARRRLYVGVDDRRLYGTAVLFLPHGSEENLSVLGRAAGRTFASLAQVKLWFEDLPEEKRKQLQERLEIEESALMRPLERSRPRRLPRARARLVVSGFPGLHPLRSVRRGTASRHHPGFALVESKVNQPLADSLFTVKLKDGVQVNDWVHDPPLVYKQKGDRTPEEWKQIIDERKEQDDWQEADAVRDFLVGQEAPELPESAWVNSDPLTLASLKGKVVVLDFWATHWGGCRNDLFLAESIHKTAKESGIVVIGVHPAGAETSEINAFAKENGMSYPIVINLPVPKPDTSFGQLFKHFCVKAIPYSFLIDQKGNVAAYGSLDEMLAAARKLTNQTKK